MSFNSFKKCNTLEVYVDICSSCRVYVRMCMHMCTYVCACVRTYVNMRVLLCMYVYVCVCVCMGRGREWGWDAHSNPHTIFILLSIVIYTIYPTTHSNLYTIYPTAYINIHTIYPSVHSNAHTSYLTAESYTQFILLPTATHDLSTVHRNIHNWSYCLQQFILLSIETHTIYPTAYSNIHMI